MKKLITALVALTLITTSMPAQANLKNRTSVPTLAILDTALDTSIPSIKSRLIGEVCILDWNTCPNGSKFMEGVGASNTSQSSCLATRDFNHGTQMASVAVSNNPNMNILFVRIIGNTKDCFRQSTSINTVPNALKWLYENKDKYNIKAISMSQGHHNLLKGNNYCPVSQTDYWVEWFKAVNIPIFFPAGNGRDYQRIDWPACIPSSISVGGVEMENPLRVSFNSNYDKNLLDIYTPISSNVLFPGGGSGTAYGTSISVQIAAAQWLSVSTLKPNMTLDQVLNLIKSTGTSVTNSIKSDGIFFNLNQAING